MQFWIIIKISLRGLLANKLRSFLTMLGVIIGVGAVIAMLAIGEGAKLKAQKQIESLGVSTLTLRPGMRGMQGAKTADSQNLTMADAEAIRREIPAVLSVAPEFSGTSQVTYGSKNTRTRVVGTTPDYLSARAFNIEKGRMFSPDDDVAVRQYCVLGPQVVDDLFAPGEDPVGKQIRIGQAKTFTVIGVLEAKGDQGFYNPDNQLYIPLSAAMKRVFGSTAGAHQSIQSLHIRMDAGGEQVIVQMATAEAQLERLMRARHNIPEGETSDFNIRNMAEYLRQSEEQNKTFKILLGGVAGISLLVGGIGIMNIMLVTVTERTREIGIRKALGARPWDILKQFIIEAVVVSLLGGLLGIASGLGAAALIPKLNEFTRWLSRELPSALAGWVPVIDRFETAPTSSSVVMSFAFAAAVGVFFGYYPARKAAKMDPIEALRYE